MSQSEEVLKACPFCQSERVDFEKSWTSFAYCEDCDCEGPNCKTPAEAVAAWNSRPEEDRLRARVAELEGQIQYEQHRAGRIGTHGVGCETWGPQHYECAMRKLSELEGERDAWKAAHGAVTEAGVRYRARANDLETALSTATSEVERIKVELQIARELGGDTRADDFGRLYRNMLAALTGGAK